MGKEVGGKLGGGTRGGPLQSLQLLQACTRLAASFAVKTLAVSMKT